MKIIGSANEEYILQVTKDELANIMGLYGSYESGFSKTVSDGIKERSNFEISKIYKNHALLEEIKKGDNIIEARNKLTRMLTSLKPIENLIQSLPNNSK